MDGRIWKIGAGEERAGCKFPFFIFFFIEFTLNSGRFGLRYLRRWLRFIWDIPHLMGFFFFFFSFVSFLKFIPYRLISPWENAMCRRSYLFWHENLFLNSQVIGSLHACVCPVCYKINTINNNCKSL